MVKIDKNDIEKLKNLENETKKWRMIISSTIVSFAAVIILLIFAIFLGAWFYVPGGSNAVVLNKIELNGVKGYQDSEYSEGFYLKYPIVQSATNINYRTQTVNFCNPETSPNTKCHYGPLVPKDINGVNFYVDVTVRYHMNQSQIAEFVRYKGNMAQAEELLKTAARADSTRSVFGEQAQEDVPALREELNAMIMEKLQERVDIEAIGSLQPRFIIIEAVDIRNIDFNDEIEKRIIEKLKKKQLAEEKVFDIIVANRTREEQVILADKDRLSMVIKANGTAQAILLEATAKAEGIEKINKAYQDMPEAFVYTKFAEAIQPTDKVYFGFDSLGGNQLNFLDMNQVIAAHVSD